MDTKQNCCAETTTQFKNAKYCIQCGTKIPEPMNPKLADLLVKEIKVGNLVYDQIALRDKKVSIPFDQKDPYLDYVIHGTQHACSSSTTYLALPGGSGGSTAIRPPVTPFKAFMAGTTLPGKTRYLPLEMAKIPHIYNVHHTVDDRVMGEFIAELIEANIRHPQFGANITIKSTVPYEAMHNWNKRPKEGGTLVLTFAPDDAKVYDQYKEEWLSTPQFKDCKSDEKEKAWTEGMYGTIIGRQRYLEQQAQMDKDFVTILNQFPRTIWYDPQTKKIYDEQMLKDIVSQTDKLETAEDMEMFDSIFRQCCTKTYINIVDIYVMKPTLSRFMAKCQEWIEDYNLRLGVDAINWLTTFD